MRFLISSLFGLAFSLLHSQEVKTWSLQEMLNYAAEHNLTIKNATINNKLLDNSIIAAKRQRLPSVNASINNSLVIGTTDLPITGANQQVIGKTNGYQQYHNSLGIDAGMTLYNHGKFKLNEEKAEIDLAVAKEDLKAILNDIYLQIINQYLSISLNKELVKTAEEQLNISQEQLKRNKVLFDNGSIALSQVYESESLVAQDLQSLSTAKINVEEAKFNLAQILQLPDYRTFDIQEMILPEKITNGLYNLEEIISYAYANQPVIKSAELNINSLEKDIEISKTDYWPTISANYGFGTSFREYLNDKKSADNLFNQWWDNHSHSISVGIQIPIFNKYLTDLNVENAKIRMSLAENQVDIKKQKLKQDIQTAYFQVNNTYEKYVSAQQAVKSAQLAFDFAKKSFEAEKITIYDFNQASNKLFQNKSLMIQAKYNFIFRLKVLDFYAGKTLTSDYGINP